MALAARATAASDTALVADALRVAAPDWNAAAAAASAVQGAEKAKDTAQAALLLSQRQAERAKEREQGAWR